MQVPLKVEASEWDKFTTDHMFFVLWNARQLYTAVSAVRVVQASNFVVG